MKTAKSYFLISILCGYHYVAMPAQLSRALYEFKNALTHLSQTLQQPKSQFQPPPISIQQEKTSQNISSRSEIITHPKQPAQPQVIIQKKGQQQITDTELQKAIAADNNIFKTEQYYLNQISTRLQKINIAPATDIPQDIYGMATGTGNAAPATETNYVNITQFRTETGAPAKTSAPISGLMKEKIKIPLTTPRKNDFSIKIAETRINLPKEAIKYFAVFQGQFDLDENNKEFELGNPITEKEAPLISHLTNTLVQPLIQNKTTPEKAYAEIIEKIGSISDADLAQLYFIADFLSAELLSQLIFKELLNRLVEATQGKNKTSKQFAELIDAISKSAIPEELKIELILQAHDELDNQGALGRGFNFKSGLPRSMDFYNNVFAVGRDEVKVYSVNKNALSIIGQTRFKENERLQIRSALQIANLNIFDSFFTSYNHINFVKLMNTNPVGSTLFVGVDRSKLGNLSFNLYRQLYEDSSLNIYRTMPLGNSWWGPIIKSSQNNITIKSTIQSPIRTDLMNCIYFDINRAGTMVLMGNKTEFAVLSQSSLKASTITTKKNELASISTAALSDDGKLLIIAGHDHSNKAAAIIYEVTDGNTISLKKITTIFLKEKEKNKPQWDQELMQVKIAPDMKKCAILIGNDIHIYSLKNTYQKIRIFHGMLQPSAISFWENNEIAITNMDVKPLGTKGTHVILFGKLSIYPITSKMKTVSSFNNAIAEFARNWKAPMAKE